VGKRKGSRGGSYRRGGSRLSPADHIIQRLERGSSRSRMPSPKERWQKAAFVEKQRAQTINPQGKPFWGCRKPRKEKNNRERDSFLREKHRTVRQGKGKKKGSRGSHGREENGVKAGTEEGHSISLGGGLTAFGKGGEFKRPLEEGASKTRKKKKKCYLLSKKNRLYSNYRKKMFAQFERKEAVNKGHHTKRKKKTFPHSEGNPKGNTLQY